MTVKIHTLFETPSNARITAQNYIEDPRSEQKSDLIEGVFIVSSPASRLHEQIVAFLLMTLGNFVEVKQLGQVLSSNAAYQLSADNVFQPDVSFVRTERLHLARDIYFLGPPDIAVEVISPSSRQYDTVEKKINYGRFGVKEYWLIDPINRGATFFEQINGQCIPIQAETGIVRSRLLDGFWLRLDWLFPPPETQRPNPLDVARMHHLF